MQNRKQKKTLRLAMVLGATVAGTAVIGWGGLAAWQAYTENDGNTVAAGTLQHANTTSATCTSTFTLPVTPSCAKIWVNVTGVSPNTAGTLASGTVKVDNTGTLNSTFVLRSVTAGTATVAAPSGGLCADLNLNIKDANNATIYNGAMSGINGPYSLNNNAATPAATWTGGGVAGTGTGATGNTFTFTVTWLTTTNSADSGTSCVGDFQFVQTSA